MTKLLYQMTRQRLSFLATAGGRLLRFKVNDEQLPIMGRTAVGLRSVATPEQEE